MTKRERFLKVLANEPVDRVPVAFFHHFTGPSDWNMGLENPEAFERNIEGHRPALEKFDPDTRAARRGSPPHTRRARRR